VAISPNTAPNTSAASGQTVPLSWYADQSVYERELKGVFRHGWQYAGSIDRLAESASYFTSWIARTPVVVVKDADGDLRAFANVCPHRGHAVAEGQGTRRTLQCRYHGWTFALDGKLRSAPRTDNEPSFDRECVGLRQLAVGRWGPLIFVNPEPQASFNAAADPLIRAAGRRGLDIDAFPRRATREWELACNWKVTLDNNTECYHCATVHPTFASNYYVDSDHYLVEGHEYCFTHESPMRRSDNTSPAPDFHLYYLWPNFMLSARRTEYFYIYHYRPVGPNRTLQVNDYFFPADWSDEQVDETIDQISVIMKEDWAAFESVQRGIESGMIERGIVLPEEEGLLCHFQALLADALAD
jgi:phenylpropionate dioxygenase-like ring-hydroxylating dioxygenase large terminal subunit